MGAAFAVVAQPVGGGENQHDQSEDQRETHHPDELRCVGLFFEIEIPRQRVNRGDADDRAEQLLLQRAEIDLGEPFGPVRMIGRLDPADEVLIARENDDEDEIGGQRQIDQIQHTGDDIVPVRHRRLNDQQEQIAEETVHQHEEAQQKTEQKRRQQPAAEENRRLDVASVGPAHETPQENADKEMRTMPPNRRRQSSAASCHPHPRRVTQSLTAPKAALATAFPGHFCRLWWPAAARFGKQPAWRVPLMSRLMSPAMSRMFLLVCALGGAVAMSAGPALAQQPAAPPAAAAVSTATLPYGPPVT